MRLSQKMDSWYMKEDYWAILIALGVVTLSSGAFMGGMAGMLKVMSINIPAWSTDLGKLASYIWGNTGGIVTLFTLFAAAFAGAGRVMGYKTGNYLASFTLLFILSLVVTALGSNKLLKEWQLETPLLALLLGLVLSNTANLPAWFKTGLRTEFYVKTGIVLMGATLPFTVIVSAGPLAILQATIVAVSTFAVIYFAATRLFGLDERFGATLAAGGSICGVSASIAIGGACRAEKEHVSVSISMVVIWAVVMIFVLPLLAKGLGLAPGPAGAWIGTSEFADAAGFAAAEAIGDERAVKTFTLMKVVGRDMFVGVWALIAAFLSVTVWENKKANQAEKISLSEVWRRFPKFIIGFFAASVLVTLILTHLAPDQAAQFNKDIIAPLKTLRGWAFTWGFLSIGLTTRFRELASFGWKPLAAFAVGVAVNVPLGYILSNIVLVEYWMGIK